MSFSPSIFLNLLIAGIFLGGIYSLVSIGLTLIFGTLKLVNFAHGALMMVSMYLTFWLWALLGIDPLISLPISFGLFFSIGYALQKILIMPIIQRPVSAQMLMTLGLLLVIQNAVIMLWSATPRQVVTDFANLIFRYGELYINFPRFAAFVVAMTLSGILHLFLTRTDLGTAIRATAQDSETAKVLGIDVNKVYALSFGLGTACAAVAGNLISTFYPIDPFVGDTFLLMAFIAIVLGSMGNYIGAFIAGLILGVVEIFTAFVLSSLLRQAVPLIIFLLLLLLKPEGLFGGRLRE